MISPRKNELEAVVAVLESEDYESSQDMAKAIVRALAAEFGKRDGYGVAIGLKTDNLRLAHGPYFTVMDAKRVVREAEARGLVAFLAPLLGADNALREEEEATSKRCVCGHPRALHGIAMKPKALGSVGCGVYKNKVKCPCSTYEAA